MELETITVGPLQENCYVAWESPEAALVVDPGDEASRIVETLERLGVRPGLVVNTHGHFDHTGAVGALVERYGVAYKVHADERAILEMTPAGSRIWGIQVAAVPEPSGTLAHGETIALGGLRIEVIHTPGHTPGGLCFHVSAEKVLFTGDTLFQRSIGRSDFPGGDGEALVASIRQRLFSLSEDTRVFPGHGPPTTIGDEMRVNPFVGLGSPTS
jgi:glyoxylase-like metal-dependent hydrolase (beta-lactamase superfamily II)